MNNLIESSILKNKQKVIMILEVKLNLKRTTNLYQILTVMVVCMPTVVITEERLKLQNQEKTAMFGKDSQKTSKK